MRKPFNSLYDDFFSTPTQTIKQEKKEEQIKETSIKTFPEKKHHLEKYILGQEESIQKLAQAMKRPLMMETNFNTLLVCGPKGSGKHTLLQRYHEFLYSQDFFSCKHPTYINLGKINDEMTLIQDIYSALHSPHHMIVFENIDQCEVAILNQLMDLCEDGDLPLKQRYSNQKDKLTLASNQLEKNLVSNLKANYHYFVFLSHQSFSSLRSQLGNHFVDIIQDIIETTPLLKEVTSQLVEKDIAILTQNIKDQFHVELSTQKEVIDYLSSCYSKEEGYHDIKKVLTDLHQDLVTYLLNNKPSTITLSYQKQTLKANDYQLLQNEDLQKAIADIQKEMDEIVGLDDIKSYIYSLRDLIFINQRRKAQGLKTDEISMHMIFTGNPGTGKTTMARLMAKYLKALGVLKNGQLLEVTRADLVASYVGQTAPKTKQVIEASLGGVLFVDEAYSLYRGKEDSFGLEAIDMLVKGMEDHRDNLVVVLAGYTKEMTTFLEANSGLKSRFANVIEFPDYTKEQLLQIAISQANKKDYQINDEAKAKLLDYFNYTQALQDKRSGNGRLARNVVEDAILKQASRIAQDDNASLTELIAKDFILD